jgi:hypothetical protein
MFPTDALQGRVTVFAGAGKACGKTAALCALAPIAQERGPVALFTIGFDGAQTRSAAGPGAPAAAVRARPGDVAITTVPLARASEARLEVIETLPGRSAIGRLCVCRAVRAGAVALVGPEHFGQLASAIAMVRSERLAESVLVDGAAGRLTQTASLPDAQFVYCARADAANCRRVAGEVEMMAGLVDLDVDAVGGGSDAGTLRLEGPLTARVLDGLAKEVTHVSMGSLGDCFLDAPSFGRMVRRVRLTVRRRVPLLAFAVALKDVKPDGFLAHAPSAAGRAVFDLYGAQAPSGAVPL